MCCIYSAYYIITSYCCQPTILCVVQIFLEMVSKIMSFFSAVCSPTAPLCVNIKYYMILLYIIIINGIIYDNAVHEKPTVLQLNSFIVVLYNDLYVLLYIIIIKVVLLLTVVLITTV